MGLRDSLEEFMLPKRAERLQAAVRERTRNLAVVLDGLHDPHNLSAAVRSCEAFGLVDLFVVESNGPLRLSSKIAQGAEKWLLVHRYKTPQDCITALREGGYTICVTDLASECIAIDDLPWQEKLALVFGNESLGLSPAFHEAADQRFWIPMCGFTESLNVSVASGISLAIGVRRRIQVLGRHADLDTADQRLLLAHWHKRSVRESGRILRQLTRRAASEVDSI